MIEVITRRQTKHDINICQTEVGINNQDFFPHPTQRNSYVGDNRSFTNAAFATGNR